MKSTENLNLTQFEENDKPDWLQHYNDDMKKIDEGVSKVGDTMPVDGGSFEDDLLLHAAQAIVHQQMIADGNIGSVEEHNEDENAHPNILLDGSE